MKKGVLAIALTAILATGVLHPHTATAAENCGITVDTVFAFCEYYAYPGAPISQRQFLEPCYNTDRDLYLKLYLSPGCSGEAGFVTVTIAKPSGQNISVLRRPKRVSFSKMAQKVVTIRLKGTKLLVGPSEDLRENLKLKITPVSATDAIIAERAVYDLLWQGERSN
jgi:hypothetical protein